MPSESNDSGSPKGKGKGGSQGSRPDPLVGRKVLTRGPTREFPDGGTNINGVIVATLGGPPETAVYVVKIAGRIVFRIPPEVQFLTG